MKFLISTTFLFFCHPLLAITPEQVVQSSLNHFPKVIQAVQNFEIESSKLTEAKGTFDGSIKGKVNARTDGFYDGDAYEVSVEKPIPYFNSKVFGGRRHGFGQFPSYEGKNETLSDGEDFVGLSISLLRDSLIDQNRYNIRYLEQSREQANYDLDLVKINVQTMALKAYWTWYAKGHELKVYRSILDLAQTRDKQLRKRIKAGDLAQIYASENKQYILKRQAQVYQKQMEFQEANFYLSLFYRDSKGEPQSVSEAELPDFKSANLPKLENTSELVNQAMNSNLELKKLASQKKQAELDIQLGRNNFLPSVDLSYEWSQDRGAGPTSLSQEENRVMLNLEVPFEYRKGRGKLRAGKAKMKRIDTQEKWTNENIKVSSFTLSTKLNSFAEIFQLTAGQVELSEKLALAERKKFNRGASDLILVNIREENVADAKIKNLSTFLQYQFIDADIRNLQVKLMQ